MAIVKVCVLRMCTKRCRVHCSTFTPTRTTLPDLMGNAFIKSTMRDFSHIFMTFKRARCPCWWYHTCTFCKDCMLTLSPMRTRQLHLRTPTKLTFHISVWLKFTWSVHVVWRSLSIWQKMSIVLCCSEPVTLAAVHGYHHSTTCTRWTEIKLNRTFTRKVCKQWISKIKQSKLGCLN